MKCTVVLYYYLGLLQTMTALLPIFNNVTLVCDDSLTIQPLHSYGLCEGGGTSTQLEDQKGKEDGPWEN